MRWSPLRRAVNSLSALSPRYPGGQTLRQILAPRDMPGKAQFFRWLQSDPALREQYREARAFAADLLFEEREESALAATRCTTMVEVAALRLKLDMQRWVLSKRCPKRYGDKIDLTAEGGASLPIFTLQIGTA